MVGSVTTASTTQRDIGAKGANPGITATEGSPCLLQRSANVSDLLSVVKKHEWWKNH